MSSPSRIRIMQADVAQSLSFPMEENGGLAYSGAGPAFPSEMSDKLSIRIFSSLFVRSRFAAQSVLNPSLAESLASWLYAADSPLFEGLNDEEGTIVKQMTGLFDGWTGAALEEVSLRWWGFEREFGGQDGVVKNGYDGFLKILENAIRSKGGKIELDREVVSVKLEVEGQVIVSHRDASSSTAEAPQTCEAAHVICTLPLGVMRSLPTTFFEPPLPPRRLQSLQRLGFGLLNKVILSYSKPFWPEKPAWIEFLPSPADKDDPILSQVVGVQNYLPITGQPVLVLFAGASSGEALEHETAESLEPRIRRKFTRHFLSSKEGEAPQADQCIVTKWRGDKWSKGSYTYLPVAKEGEEKDAATPLDLIELSRSLWDGKLGFAGEATSVDHYGAHWSCPLAHRSLKQAIDEQRLYMALTSRV